MSYLPQQLISSLRNMQGFDEEAFMEVHHSGRQITSVRVNPHKVPGRREEQALIKKNVFAFPLGERIPWSGNGYYLEERPLFYLDPLWHAGAYYVQEPSSMCLEFVLKQLCDFSQPLRVLDLCAAPGGKSTLISGLLSEGGVLVSNEAIASRTPVLEENIIKWGLPNVIVTQNDPKDFLRLKEYFDVILVDAPCSGSGLFRKDPDSVKEWSPEQVQLCSLRQRRILRDVIPALKINGLLIYTTCSFSQEENEDISDYLTEQFSIDNIPVPFKPEWNIVETHSPVSHSKGYRFYPYKLKGEGFFLSCFKKQSDKAGEEEGAGGIKKQGNKNVLSEISPVQKSTVGSWIEEIDRFNLFPFKDGISAFPQSFRHELMTIFSLLKVVSAGIKTGRIAGNDLIPHHALAVSVIRNKALPFVDLDLPEAVKYLRKEPFISNEIPDGWMLTTYRHYGLGWSKGIRNRVNNYYPLNWRIRK